MSFRQKQNREFAKIKKAYLTEHPYCEACLLKGKLVPAVDVHHIKARWHGDNSEDNLISLCRECHNKVHGTNAKEKDKMIKLIERAKELSKIIGGKNERRSGY